MRTQARPGVGQFLLEQENSSDYTGTVVYLDCERGQIMQCPYALTTQNIDVAMPSTDGRNCFERIALRLI